MTFPLRRRCGRSSTRPLQVLLWMSFKLCNRPWRGTPSARGWDYTSWGSFAGLAVAMVIAGLYGVLSQMVSYRRREIGVRMALGATRQSVAQLILRQGSILIGTGLGVGLLLAFAAARFIKGFLYHVQLLDLWTYGAAALTLLVIGLLAALLPARKAASIEPVQALRED